MTKAVPPAEPDRPATFRTSSGFERAPTYEPDPRPAGWETRVGRPGEPPFVRGVQPTMYRGRLWTMRQYAGFSTAEESNRRYRALLAGGTSGLSVAFDLPTQIGYDPDHSLAAGEVGRAGVSVATLDDVETLFDGIPLDRVSVSMTINSTAVVLLSFLLAVAKRRGLAEGALSGTLQNDMLKEFAARGTYRLPVAPSLRVVTDVIAYTAERMPRWNPISISGYHIREAGATAVQEVAFTLADGFAYVELGLERGLAVNAFARRLSFFFDAHIDFFEEIAKFRAGRRVWARGMRDHYGATDERAQWLRFHTQTAGVSLTAQQPQNNVVRTAVEALAAVLGGTNSLHTNALDEVLGLPTDAAAEVALRTQQVLLEETGAASVIDPLGGSWFVEALTDRIDHEVQRMLADIRGLGADGSMTEGIVAGLESGWFISKIADAAAEHQQSLEDGSRRIVGVNAYTSTLTEPLEILQIPPQVERDQREALAVRRAARDPVAVRQALGSLVDAAGSTDNLVPPMLDAVRVEGTIGEICGALRSVFGEYREPAVF